MCVCLASSFWIEVICHLSLFWFSSGFLTCAPVLIRSHAASRVCTALPWTSSIPFLIHCSKIVSYCWQTFNLGFSASQSLWFPFVLLVLWFPPQSPWGKWVWVSCGLVNFFLLKGTAKLPWTELLGIIFWWQENGYQATWQTN